MMFVSLQLAIVEATPPSETVLVPCVVPKPDPEMVTNLPILPVVGDRPLMLSPSGTVKLRELLAIPLTITTTLPVVAPVGTGTTIEPEPQFVGVAEMPLYFTVLVP